MTYLQSLKCLCHLYILLFDKFDQNPPDSFNGESSHLQPIGQGDNANGHGHEIK